MAPENDAVSVRMATINENLKKKQEIPRFSGGIWDINDDKMDTSDETLAAANRDSVHLQLKTMLEYETPYFEIDDNMDTIEACSSESLSFLSPSYLEVSGVRDVTEAKVPVVQKKEPDNLKKKSLDELSLAQSKRCRTSSKTEVYPLESSFDVESEFSQAEMLKEFRPVESDNAEPILLKDENNLVTQTLDLNSPTICQESQIAINDNNMQKGAVGLMIEEQNLYQKEIDVLRKVALILEGLGTNTKQEHKSYSEEVGHLQRICHVLKNLENNCLPASNGTLEVNKSVASGNLAGEAAFTNIHHNENQSTELSNDNDPLSVNHTEVVLDKSSETEAICSESQSSWLEQIVNGTLPLKIIGKPPPATAFVDGSVPSTNVPKVINSSIQSSLSRTNSTLPQASADEMLQLKANSAHDRVLETDEIFELLKNATSRGSPPPMPAFGKSATTSPSRTVYKSSLTTKNTPLQMVASVDTVLPPGISKKKDDLVAVLDESSLNFPKQNATIEKGYEKSRSCCASTSNPAAETAQVSLNDIKQKIKERDNVTMMKDAVQPSTLKYVPPHLRSNSQEAQDFRPEAKISESHLKSSSKTRESCSPYQAKERKGTEMKDPIKPNVQAMNSSVIPSSRRNKAPRFLKQKSPLKYDISNQPAQSFKTEACSKWRKEDSPPKPNDLSSSSSRHGTADDNYTKLLPKDEKVLNLNVKMDSSSSRSNPSECPDSFKSNRATSVYDRRQLPNERKVLNIDVRKEKSAYGGQKDAMISLKIFDEQNALVDEELILNLNEVVQRIKNFPILSEVVPSTGEKDKVLLLSGNAVNVFLKCVFSWPVLIIPGWEIALEAYYMAKKYGIVKLQEQCREYFDFKPIQTSQVQGIVDIARKFQITEVLKNSTMFAEVQAHSIPGSTMKATIKERKCTVSCIVLAEPSEYLLPIYYVKETGLGSRIESDITNNIIFEAKSGTFCLTGLQIKLEAENSDFRKEVRILCDVYKSNKKVFDLERVKPLKKLMIINFKQKLLIEPGESAAVSVLMEDACMRMCHCLTKEKEFGRCADGSFEVSFESDRKSEAKQPLFFVEKLFYTFEGRKN